MEKAVELYQGALLEDGYYSWTEGIQQHYEINYAELLNRLADYYGKETNELKARYYEEKIRNCR
jgi:two-component SAPR family response regulator